MSFYFMSLKSLSSIVITVLRNTLAKKFLNSLTEINNTFGAFLM